MGSGWRSTLLCLCGRQSGAHLWGLAWQAVAWCLDWSHCSIECQCLCLRQIRVDGKYCWFWCLWYWSQKSEQNRSSKGVKGVVGSRRLNAGLRGNCGSHGDRYLQSGGWSMGVTVRDASGCRCVWGMWTSIESKSSGELHVNAGFLWLGRGSISVVGLRVRLLDDFWGVWIVWRTFMIDSKRALIPFCSVVCIYWKFDNTSWKVLNDSVYFMGRDSSFSPCWSVNFWVCLSWRLRLVEWYFLLWEMRESRWFSLMWWWRPYGLQVSLGTSPLRRLSF